jgi:hypothetical protein
MTNRLWNKYEEMKELMGAENLLDELMRALSEDEARENLEWISDQHDLGVF